MSLHILVLERSYPSKPASESLPKEPKFLIWSFEHDAWWAPNRQGYVRDSACAGVYGFVEAAVICANANLSCINEAMVPATAEAFGKEIAR